MQISTWLSSRTTEELQEMLETASAAMAEGKTVTSFSSLGTSATYQNTWFASDAVEAITRELVRRGVITLFTKPIKTGRILHGC